ncbi:MAG: hypothetical protein CEN90_691 [Parcubacteria group bacterium Licking1014_17]|nr:MAG: hypothetical protein CEN90_691 [Parcubacteria group bacterium Licking1014_17]
MNPQIVIENYQGTHNANLQQSVARLEKGRGYRDLSTICIVPTRGMIPAKVTQAWMGMIAPMNQKFTRIFMIGMEVGEAYTAAVENILNHPELSKWKYILTLEEDNIPPPDGLLKLYENIDDFDAIGGLYWTKGEGGQPMIYGDPNDPELNFRPQPPVMDIQPCNGLGMGFTLFKMDIFKDSRIEKPMFKTWNEWDPQKGVKMYTQDLYFFEKIKKLGYRVACDTRVRVGHYDVGADVVW